MQTSPSSTRERRQAAAVCLLLATITFAVFGQTLTHDFIEFDDNAYVYSNPVVREGFTVRGFVWAFSFHAFNWHPLTWFSHMLDCQLYGLHPGGHHATSVMLHAATAIALFLVLRQMTGALRRSAFVAAVFAIHPLRAESVAWVAERKDVLSGLFFVLTIGAYVRFVKQNRAAAPYALSLLFFVLALMAKPMVVTLPVVLLLLDFWPLRRKEPLGKLLVEKLPFAGLSAAACMATLMAQSGVIQPTSAFSMPLRLENALMSVGIYLWEMVWPAGLALFYPHPFSFPAWQLGVAALLLGGLTAAGILHWRQCPWLLTGWLWYLVMLLPVVGIVQVGGQAHADRYTYLPQIGIYVALTWLVANWITRPAIAALGATGIVAALMVCAWKQTAYWKNSESVWTRSLTSTQRNEVAHYGLANALVQKGNVDAAILQYQEALQIKPNYEEAENNLGIALDQKNLPDEAMIHYRRALEIQPDYAPANYNVGSALLKKGRPDEAMACFQKAIEKDPDYAAAHFNLGNALFQKGDVDGAIVHFQKAVEIDPASADTHNNLGNAFLQKGRLNDAMFQFQTAQQLDPKIASAHLNLGIVFLQKGGINDAIGQFQTALSLKTNYAAAHYNLGNAFVQAGLAGDAIRQFEQALKLTPDDVETQNNLAWLLATSPQPSLRDSVKALQLARQANARTGGGNPIVLHTLAAALAENGHFKEAIRAAQKARELARGMNQKDLVEQIDAELKSFAAGHPYRE